MFKEYKSTYRTDRDYTFSPTELKNYPCQGLATGDIVPLLLGILFRKFVNRDGIKLVNTVHDSILFDMRDDVKAQAIIDIAEVLNNSHKYFEATFGHPLELKLSVTCQMGKNWYEQEEVKL